MFPTLLSLLLSGPFGGAPVAPPVTSFRATLRHPAAVRLAWQAPDTLSIVASANDSAFTSELRRRGTLMTSGSGSGAGFVERGLFNAEPDAYVEPLAQIAGSVPFLLGRARGGGPAFSRSTVGGRAALVTSYTLHGNECAGFKSGTATVWLDEATLLPVRRIERREGAAAVRLDLAYRDVSAPLPPSAFVGPALGATPVRAVHGFVRSSVREAAAHLRYRPLVPHTLPPGYALASAGWAKRSQVTGPEGSNPRYAGFFGAVYQRGFEHIDLTERLARTGSWPSDPFGVECGIMQTTRVSVNGQTAWFGTSPDSPPHLYWRAGKLLFTLSGPFPKADLLTIAETLS